MIEEKAALEEVEMKTAEEARLKVIDFW